ncbi:hypothetical protein D1872_261970 [compost metagenome]
MIDSKTKPTAKTADGNFVTKLVYIYSIITGAPTKRPNIRRRADQILKKNKGLNSLKSISIVFRTL